MLQQSLVMQSFPSGITTRVPTIQDGAPIADLVRSTGVLEPNTTYAYVILSHHFATTSAVAECRGKVVGCLLGYRLPARPTCLFVWQIGTAETHRRLGIGRQLLQELQGRPALADVTHVEFTVASTNAPSLALFQSWARDMNADLRAVGQFSSELFSSTENACEAGHEDEELYRIGPLARRHHEYADH